MPMIQQTIIRPRHGWVPLDIAELKRYRELLYIFTWRDLKVRYKQTILGVLWAIFQPLLTMAVFTVFFGRLAKIPSDNVPYPVFVFTGLLFWNYFSQAVSTSGNSLVDQESLIKKIYFPRLLLPMSATITPLVDLLIALVILVILSFVYGFVPGVLGLLFLPLLLSISFLSAAGLGTLLASINVKFRDVRYIIPFFIQILLFLTPVIYPSSLVATSHRWILGLNPMSGVIETARATIIGARPIPWDLLGIGGLVAIVLFLVGTFYLRATERSFADVV